MTHPMPSTSTTDLPDGYRMTELGPLPKEWRVVRLGEVYSIQQGKALSPKHRKGKSPYPFLRTANVLWGSVDLSNLDMMDFTEEERSKLRLQPGDLLICEGGEIGRTATWEGGMKDVFYQNHIFRVRAITIEVHPYFHMYWMQAAIKVLGLYRGRGNKTTIPNLSKRRLAEFPLPLPPLPEQRAIAHVLRAVQDAREATARVIAALRDLKRSLMRHLFTYGPVPVGATGRSPLQQTDIGPIPAHWRVVRLGEVVERGGGSIQTGPFGSQLHASDYVPSGVPVVMPRDLSPNGKINSTNITFIREEDKQRLERHVLHKGDLVVARRGELGRRGLVTEDEDGWLCGTGCFRVRPGEYVNSMFLSALFGSNIVREQLAANAIGTTMANLNARILKNLLVPLPPLDEQREIARILQTVDRKIEAEETRKEALDDLFRSLLHHLMTAKIRLPQEFVQRFVEEG